MEQQEGEREQHGLKGNKQRKQRKPASHPANMKMADAGRDAIDAQSAR